MEYLYLICLLVAIGMLIWLKIFDVRNSISQYFNLIIIIISSFGYFLLSISRTLEEAIFSQIIGYVGGIFFSVFYFFVVLEICHLELSQLIRIILVLCQVCIYGFVCTMGRGELFYKSVTMHIHNGMVVLDKVYGPMHIFAIGSMYLYFLLSFAAVIYTLTKKKSVERKNVITMLVLMAIAIGSYSIEKIIGIQYTVIPIMFDVLMLIAFIPI